MTMPDGSGAPGGGPPPPSDYPAPGAPPSGYPPAGPPSYVQPAASPPKKNRQGLAALIVLVVIIAVAVGGYWLFRDRISGDVNQLAVGDCIDEPSGSADNITDVQHQPCTDPHDGEVFANLNYPGADGAPYPILSSSFEDFVSTNCLPLAETYTGRTLDEIDAAGLSYGFFYPTSSSWTENNDRGVTCYLQNDDGTKLVGSVRAAAPASP